MFSFLDVYSNRVRREQEKYHQSIDKKNDTSYDVEKYTLCKQVIENTFTFDKSIKNDCDDFLRKYTSTK
jgi:hypothetical protein